MLSFVFSPCLLSSAFFVCLVSLLTLPFLCRQEVPPPFPVSLASVDANASLDVALKEDRGDAASLPPSNLSPKRQVPAEPRRALKDRDCQYPSEVDSAPCVDASSVPAWSPSSSGSLSTGLSRFFSPYASSLSAYSPYLPVRLAPRPPASEVLDALVASACLLSRLREAHKAKGEAEKGFSVPHFSTASSGKETHASGEPQRDGAYFACLAVVVMDGDSFRCVPIPNAAALKENVGKQYALAETASAYSLFSPPLRSFALSTLSLLPTSLFAAADEAATSEDVALFPPYEQSPWPGKCKRLSQCTLLVRIAAIDAPETAKRRPEVKTQRSAAKQKAGKQARRLQEHDEIADESTQRTPNRIDIDEGGQPFSVAAASRLASEILGRVVLVKQLGKDRYGRTLARVFRVTHDASFATAVRDAMKKIKMALMTGERPTTEKAREEQVDAEEPEGYEPGTGTRQLSVKRTGGQRTERKGIPSAGLAALAGGFVVGLLKTEAEKLGHHIKLESAKAGAAAKELATKIFIEEVLEKKTKEAADVLLREGLAVVYTQGGAKFDGRKNELLVIEQEAKRNKLGFWGIPESARETPAEYKKRKRSE
ncbi:conserved hypothetical protein [Neospora caninum Liverpool]|uniref:Nuclease, putative n=1 Tax=Neospora caninum (strain Liverpool) TaxID=572307 RepID=F0VQM8_NEOCL|nr:conserved hypothetical protein [Neospora caninum Liverpool]CBZ56025.1 conserved hypothetical protein [Neospora caninum Liverpool]CEL70772.1 TPA: nuclease, putative [Neospora caninum Liverpool]|eukprot:XP_003886051.1 conserved hypothetical protein [Neospora caninum Liverpool]